MYLVRRITWDSGYGMLLFSSEADQGSPYNSSGERYLPTAIFGTQHEAKAEAEGLELAARSGRGPFWFAAEWQSMTDLSGEEATARLQQRGLLPADSSKKGRRGFGENTHAWREWWDRESVNWTTEQLADAWAVFNKLRFYDVVEIEVEE